MQRLFGVWVASFFLLGIAFSWGEESPNSLDFFEKKIRPVLVKQCYECHSVDSKEIGGEMVLDTRAGIRKGGESGPSVVPKNIKKSLIIEAIEYDGLEMPPDAPLPPDVIADFRRWVELGAPDPREGEIATPAAKESTAISAEELWSLQPLGNPQPPKTGASDWPLTDVDRFVLAKMEEQGLQPVKKAEPLDLLRRLSFDLTGLPPSLEALAEFEADSSSQAYEAMVDRMLDSPAYGERWGRHWLDVARYAESNGRSRDVLTPDAWRYRDYVIDAFNADLPFNRFITEQLAGDLLPADSPQERDRLRTATGFLAVGSKTLVGGGLQFDLIDEQIDVTGRAFLGLAVGCARCHDHKFDPIPTRDYYAMAGLFLSTETLFGGGLKGAKDLAGKANALMVLGENSEGILKELQLHQRKIATVTKKRAAVKKRLQQLQKKTPAKKNGQKPAKKNGQQGNKNAEAAKTASKQKQAVDDLQEKVAEFDKELKELKKQQPAGELKFALGVREGKKPQDCNIRIRGEASKSGDLVPRGFLSCLPGSDLTVDPTQSGRLQLAEWLVQSDNPLTPRVAVNRIWLRLFGRGIVDSVDNFGANGSKPTPPELLDHLARRFVANGWSFKKTIRELVLSRAYRASSDFDSASAAIDPAAEYYWRVPRRRLEAEAIHDAMLAASGELNLQRPHASAVARIGDGEVGRNINLKPLSEPFPHRGAYLPIIRGIVPELLKTFDFPEPSNVQGQRTASNVPTQSLFLMNSPFVIEQAERMSERILAAKKDDANRVETAYRLCFGRSPSDDETASALEFIHRKQEQQAGRETAGKDKKAMLPWAAFCQALFASSEFRFIP